MATIDEPFFQSSSYSSYKNQKSKKKKKVVKWYEKNKLTVKKEQKHNKIRDIIEREDEL